MMNYIPVLLGILILITNPCNLGRPSSFLFVFHIIYKASLLTKMFLKNRNFSWRLGNSGPGFLNCVCIVCRQPRNPMLWRFLLKTNLCSYVSHVGWRTCAASCWWTISRLRSQSGQTHARALLRTLQNLKEVNIIPHKLQRGTIPMNDVTTQRLGCSFMF